MYCCTCIVDNIITAGRDSGVKLFGGGKFAIGQDQDQNKVSLEAEQASKDIQPTATNNHTNHY